MAVDEKRRCELKYNRQQWSEELMNISVISLHDFVRYAEIGLTGKLVTVEAK